MPLNSLSQHNIVDILPQSTLNIWELFIPAINQVGTTNTEIFLLLNQRCDHIQASFLPLSEKHCGGTRYGREPGLGPLSSFISLYISTPSWIYKLDLEITFLLTPFQVVLLILALPCNLVNSQEKKEQGYAQPRATVFSFLVLTYPPPASPHWWSDPCWWDIIISPLLLSQHP